MKTCTKCGEEKRLAEFYVWDGKYKAECKPCAILRAKEYARKNKETVSKKKHNAYLKKTEGIVTRFIPREIIDGKLTCNTCNANKTTSEFPIHKNSRLGVGYKCKTCMTDARVKNRHETIPNYTPVRVRKFTEVGFVCRDCNTDKPLSDYVKNKANILGIDYRCKECRKIYTKNNEAAIRLKVKQHRVANKKNIAKIFKSWSVKNKPKLKAKAAKRLADVDSRTPIWASRALILNVYEQAVELMELWGEVVHVDHFYPLRGKQVSGLHVWENLQLLSATANHQKYNKHPDEIVYLGWLYPQALKSHPLYEGG